MTGQASLTGLQAEQAAEHWLTRQGLTPLARNFRTRRGELDLVMWHGRTLAFIEVRYRRPGRFGDGADSITASKRARLVAAAQQFLQTHRIDAPCRFDVLSVSPGQQQALNFRWIPDAFRVEA